MSVPDRGAKVPICKDCTYYRAEDEKCLRARDIVTGAPIYCEIERMASISPYTCGYEGKFYDPACSTELPAHVRHRKWWQEIGYWIIIIMNAWLAVMIMFTEPFSFFRFVVSIVFFVEVVTLLTFVQIDRKSVV